MILEIHISKKDFYEQCLVDLVQMRNLGAILFVNRTINRDRGYNDKIEVEHSGTVVHTGFTIDELDMPPDMLRGLLQVVRTAEEKKKAIDAEIVEPKQLEEKIEG